MFEFTRQNASELVLIFSPMVSVLATYLIAQETWSKLMKAVLAFALSALFAILVAYAEGSLVENFWSNFVTIYAVAQGIYWSLFKGAGFEQALNDLRAKRNSSGDLTE